MRILHLSDTHLGDHGHFRLPPGAPARWTRAADHVQALALALRPALDQQVDLVVHTGDLFDRSRPPLRAIRQAADLLVEAARRVPTLVVPGNHDRRGLERYLPWNAPGLTVTDRPLRLRIRGLIIGLVPFCRRAAEWAVHARTATGAGVDLLATHMAFDGARVPGLVFRAHLRPDTVGPQHLPPGVRHVLCGHIHPRQVVRVGDAQVVHPGATERSTFAEAQEPKGVALWTLGGEPCWTFADLPVRPMALVKDERDLDRVQPGTLVRVPRADPALAEAVLARGGWLAVSPAPPAPPPPDRQAPLFGQDAMNRTRSALSVSGAAGGPPRGS